MTTMEMIPAPSGAFRAVYRDLSTPDGLVVHPVIGFAPVEEPTSAAIIGGPTGTRTFNPPPRSANQGADAVPVVLTRRGEVRATVTVLPNSPNDVFFAATPDFDLVPDTLPQVAYLGIVDAHEDPAEVFAEHVTAAREHREAVEAARERAALPAPEPVRTVDAQVRPTPRVVDPAEVIAAALRYGPAPAVDYAPADDEQDV